MVLKKYATRGMEYLVSASGKKSSAVACIAMVGPLRHLVEALVMIYLPVYMGQGLGP